MTYFPTAHALNTDTQMKWTLWHIPLVSVLTGPPVCVRVPFKRIAFDLSDHHAQLQVGLVFVRHGNNFSWTSSDHQLLFAALHEDPYFRVTSEENLAPVMYPLPAIAQMSSFCSCVNRSFHSQPQGPSFLLVTWS